MITRNQKIVSRRHSVPPQVVWQMGLMNVKYKIVKEKHEASVVKQEVLIAGEKNWIAEKRRAEQKKGTSIL